MKRMEPEALNQAREPSAEAGAAVPLGRDSSLPETQRMEGRERGPDPGHCRSAGTDDRCSQRRPQEEETVWLRRAPTWLLEEVASCLGPGSGISTAGLGRTSSFFTRGPQ